MFEAPLFLCKEPPSDRSKVLQCYRLPPEGTTGRKPNLGEDLPGSLNSFDPPKVSSPEHDVEITQPEETEAQRRTSRCVPAGARTTAAQKPIWGDYYYSQ